MQLTYTKSWLLILVIGFFVFLFRLQYPVVREWDEATYGINAYEMSVSGNPIVITFEGQPDVYNSKPPLGVWLMSLSTKCFGVNTFSLRFASAFISFLLSCFLFHFIFKRYRQINFALFTSFILYGTIGFTGWHEARSGDLDAMVAAFITLYVLNFLESVQDRKPYQLLTVAFWLSAACLCKGIYGVVAIPGLFLFLVLSKQLKWCLSQWQFYAGLMSFLFVFLGYYYLRELYTPGYLQAVFQNEIGERVFLETNIHKKEIPFYYHTLKMLVYRYQPFILLLPIAVYKWIKTEKNEQYYFLLGVLLSSLSILSIISISKTKLVWYDGSLYPLFAIFIAWFLSVQTEKIQNYLSVFLLLMIGFVILLNQKEKDSFGFPGFLKNIREDQKIHTPLKVLSHNFEHPIKYCLLQDSLAGFQSKFCKDISQINENDILVVRNELSKKSLSRKFVLKSIYKEDGEELFRVQSQ